MKYILLVLFSLFIGSECQLSNCQNINETILCSGNGKCLNLTGSHECECNSTHNGDFCQNIISISDDDDDDDATFWKANTGYFVIGGGGGLAGLVIIISIVMSIYIVIQLIKFRKDDDDDDDSDDGDKKKKKKKKKKKGKKVADYDDYQDFIAPKEKLSINKKRKTEEESETEDEDEDVPLMRGKKDEFIEPPKKKKPKKTMAEIRRGVRSMVNDEYGQMSPIRSNNMFPTHEKRAPIPTPTPQVNENYRAPPISRSPKPQVTRDDIFLHEMPPSNSFRKPQPQVPIPQVTTPNDVVPPPTTDDPFGNKGQERRRPARRILRTRTPSAPHIQINREEMLKFSNQKDRDRVSTVKEKKDSMLSKLEDKMIEMFKNGDTDEDLLDLTAKLRNAVSRSQINHLLREADKFLS